MNSIQPTDLDVPDHGGRSILAKLGVAGFTFFLVKGLLWLIVPGIIAAAL